MSGWGEDDVILCTPQIAAGWTESSTYDLRPFLAPGESAEAPGGLLDRMMDAVAPDGWHDREGDVGWAFEWYDRRATISQTHEHHRFIRQWLDARLAKTRNQGAKR